ncbi:O-antigen ligase family protein [Sulfidibacter corallicola]|uniref:O-antigen ligase family protein n=1 Tax=Sulfidibacter corallicola TaxID=2818388 RepID=A0A8A4TVC8_SULCO|nr:O-antigen ligase family protein [Sulfidibacter corallicola]QTD53084.1 O-antigen ligase family protein [Sulfidibacter corallicola]
MIRPSSRTLSVGYVAACICFSGFFSQPFTGPKIAALSLLMLPLHGQPRAWSRPVCVILALLLGWSWLDFRIAGHAVDTLHGLLPWFFVAWVCWAVLPSRAAERAAFGCGLRWVALVSAGWLILFRLVSLLVPTAASGLPWIWGPGGFWGNPNFSAHVSLLGLCLGTWRRDRWDAAAQAMIAVAIFLSYSRAAAMAVILWFGWSLWRTGHTRSERSHLGIAVCLGGLAIAIFLTAPFWNTAIRYLEAPDVYVSELTEQPPLLADRDPWFQAKGAGLVGRHILFANSFALLRDVPLRGIGVGQFRVRYPEYAAAVYPDFNMNDDYRAHGVHNLLLAGAIQYGLPWMLLSLALVTAAWWTCACPRYRMAALLQGMLAMVSLNYLNPVVIATLIAMYPYPENGAQRTRSRLIGMPLFLAVMILAAFQIQIGRIEARESMVLADRLLPEMAARTHAEQGRLPEAWQAQREASRRDPHGPATYHNLALLAEAWSQVDPRIDPCLALSLYSVNAERHPFYKASAVDRDRLRSLLPDCREHSETDVEKAIERFPEN